MQPLKKALYCVCTINVHCIQCATPPSSTGTTRTKGISRIMVSVVPTPRRVVRKSHPFGIPNGRERTTLGCRRCDSHRSHIGHRICSSGRGDASNNELSRGQSDSGSISQPVGTGINMAKAKMKQAVIPKFSSEAEEAAWWDAHRSEIEAEIRQRMKQKRPLTLGSLFRGARPSQPVTLRIPKEDLETARRLAARKGLGYQTYIKMLLREALAEDASEGIATRTRQSPSRSPR